MKHGLQPEEDPNHLWHRHLTEKIIGAAFQVQQQLGYRFLECVYQRAMQVEVVRGGCAAEIEKRVHVLDKGAMFGDYDAALLANARVIVELKIAPPYDKCDEARLLNPLKATGIKVVLLVNFGRTKVENKRLLFSSVFHPC